MLRGETIICGTSTTGTGTLTLAATPGPPGGVDFDVLARATGVGFANSAAILVTYTIIEYTDSTFSTSKSMEKGIGTLTLGSSSGIANCTLARSKVQVTATSLNSQPATYNTNAPTAVSITTAANVLVFIGASASDIPAYLPYFETSIGDTLGPTSLRGTSVSATGTTLTSGTDIYQVFEWRIPMLVKRASMRVVTAYSGGTPVSNADARIYAIGSNGRPGKLLLDLGLLGSTGTSLNSGSTNISTAVHSTGYYLTPGEYYFDFLPVFSGGSAGPAMAAAGNLAGVVTVGRQGIATFVPYVVTTATGGTIGTAPDPANTTAYAGATTAALIPLFTLNSS